MSRVRLLTVVAIAMVQAATIVAAQAVPKPSFSGTWIIQPPNKAAGEEQIVKQNEKTVSIASAGRTRTYELDGIAHREARSTRVGEVVMISKAVWAGRTIVITTATSYPNDMKTTEKETWSIDSQGQFVLDVEQTSPGQAPITTKVTHKKKS